MLWALCLLLLLQSCFAYLPGVAPKEYLQNENISVKVNSLRSTHTAIPYDYYSLPVCRPTGYKRKSRKIKAGAENLGEVLWGDIIKSSPYKVQMQNNVTCALVCSLSVNATQVSLNATQAYSQLFALRHPLSTLQRRINDGYRVHMVLDNLPISEVFISERVSTGFYYRRGFPLGVPGNLSDPPHLNNHIAITVKYHKPLNLPGWRIVGFEVKPMSIASNVISKSCNGATEWPPESFEPQLVLSASKEKKKQRFSWSYSVRWVEDPTVAWTSRWDHYLHSDASDSHIHWFAIINSLAIVLALSAMVSMILLRVLHKDFNRYNRVDDDDDEPKLETGWKLVHGDVFRTPHKPRLLTVYVASGCQLLGMVGATLVMALLGYLSPARRGSLMTCILVLYSLMGFLSGYVAGRMLKMFNEENWNTVIWTAISVPGTFFGVFFCMNIMLWAKSAANAVPFLNLLILLVLWLGCSLPLVYLGAKAAFARPAISHPRSVNVIPHPVPPQHWYLSPFLMSMLSGVVPFLAAFIELTFILSSLWLNRFYYVFGFLAVVFSIVAVTCVQVSVVLTYFQLCNENYHWWWSSFMYAASSGMYLNLYSTYYFATTLHIHRVWSIVLYLGYMGLISYSFSVIAGTLGFLGTWAFVRHIYSVLKVD
eukprot:NODE_181_length_2096_cov_362.380557_g144_i0.p1 GENE.NODE_181_length_2096_cov_362.380557_g144_i0~~NODE_181_length_2096_cov_362.380557_g144_i0.p1  ORF type:complete len:670 (+),score=135.64 NODE_181_length_2096_cov_362.380557_g144_i0:60-2012(+)